MIYNELKEIIKSKEQLKGLITLYEIRNTPFETRDDKMALAIRLIQLLNWSKTLLLSTRYNIQRPFNIQTYKQALATAISHKSNEVVVYGGLSNALVELIAELNLWLPQKLNSKLLKELVLKQIETNEKQSYDDFYAGILNDFEKDTIELKRQNNELTGQSDIDWKAMSFVFNIKWEDVVITSRWQISGLTNTEVIKLIEDKISTNWFHCPEVEKLYRNIDKVQWTSKAPVLKLILISMLFIKPYNTYPWLVKNLEKLNLILDSEK